MSSNCAMEFPLLDCFFEREPSKSLRTHRSITLVKIRASVGFLEHQGKAKIMFKICPQVHWLSEITTKPICSSLPRVSSLRNSPIAIETILNGVQTVTFQPRTKFPIEDRCLVEVWKFSNGTWKFTGVFDGSRLLLIRS